MYSDVSELPLQVEEYALCPLSLDVAAGWQRLTTLVVLRGGGQEGVGEDIVYETPDQLAHREFGANLALAGTTTFGEFSDRLGEQLEQLPPCATGYSGNYRRWGYESAALDLALRQAGAPLTEVVGRAAAALTYAVSTGLGTPPSAAPLEQVLASYADSRFKVDLGDGWTPEFVAELAAFGRIDTVDYKGMYRGDFKGPAADPETYRLVAEAFPHAYLEDPAPEILDAIAPHHDRVSWDAALHSVADIEGLPFPPKVINVKPSRFGTVEELFSVYEYCESHSIAMYGGGQFELGPGRGKIQYLASLFHPDGPNDVAPSGFNAVNLSESLPPSPMAPRIATTGFRWADD